SLIINTDLGQMLEFTRQYDQAIEQMHKTIDLDPSFVNAHFVMADAYLGMGLYKEAVTEYRAINTIMGSDFSLAQSAYAHALAGNGTEAVKELKALIQSRRPQASLPFSLAMIYSALGEKDQAFKWLTTAYEQRDSDIIYLKADPRLDGLRYDRRYSELLRRLVLNP